LFIIDRIKEIWKHKGHQITPSEIENVIEKIDGVDFVSVVGIPHEIVGSLSAAVVKKKKGFEHLNVKVIEDFVASKLSYQKQLHGGVFFVDDFPKTPSGKIQKRFVRDIVVKLRSKLC
jgi:4-coumarate--CoA ligase